MGGRPAERTIQTMELAQIYEMLNGVEGGADAAASLKKNLRFSAIKPKTSDTQDIRSFQTCSKYYSVL